MCAVVVFGVMLIGCVQSNESAEMVGVYTLVSVNDQVLPFETYHSGDVREVIVAGTLSLRSSGTAHFVTEIELTMLGMTDWRADQVEGSWEQRGGSLLIDLPQDSLILARTDDGLRVPAGEYVFVYSPTNNAEPQPENTAPSDGVL